MSGDLVAWANSGFTQTVAAAILIGACNMLARKWKKASASSKTELRRKALQRLQKTLEIAQYLLFFGLIWLNLNRLLALDGPPTRREVAGIATWVVLGFATFFIFVMEVFEGKDSTPTLPRKDQQENCSSEQEDREKSAGIPAGSPTEATPSQVRPTGSGTAAP